LSKTNKNQVNFLFLSAFILILLISILPFTTFAITSHTPQNRVTIVAILLLTLVNFRWLITQRLPSVSYLTLLDKYSIGCILLLALIFAWDAIIGSMIISDDTDYLKMIEPYVIGAFVGSFSFFVLMLIMWFLKLFIGVKSFRNKNLKQYLKLKSQKNLYASGIN
jgi:hypothetical protein